jgi:diaminohydroxyphosphoribosylaminopyrimidine deaminase / 5-amino-6-(5-phosphoribosylamino)uracil reductase
MNSSSRAINPDHEILLPSNHGDAMKRDSTSTGAVSLGLGPSTADARVRRSATPPSSCEPCGGTWAQIPDLLRSSSGPLPPPWGDLFAPLGRGTVDELVVIAQIGQSLDGRIATPSGHSHYINGTAGRMHLHRLRALVDAVVVGVGTVVADDPQLTVRMVDGPNPARVVLDPRGRIPAQARVLTEDGSRRLIVTTKAPPTLPSGIETLQLQATNGLFCPAAILQGLAERGFRRILIEGGAATVSRFLAAGCLDRLHVLVAPMIIGAGRSGLALPPIDRIDGALRPPTRVHLIEDEVLFDCDLSARRVRVDAGIAPPQREIAGTR